MIRGAWSSCPGGEALFHWLTVDDDGRPVWYLGVGSLDEDRVMFMDLFHTSGPSFPAGYDPAELELTPRGEALLAFDDRYNATLTGSLNGDDFEVDLQRESSLDGTTCT